MSRTYWFGMCLLVMASAGCGQSSSNGSGGTSVAPGMLALMITDAPFPHDVIASANVVVDRVSVDRGLEQGDASRVMLHEGAPLAFELTSLRNGVIDDMLRVPLPSEYYSRLYLHFASVELTLADGRVFRSADGTLQMPEVGPEGFLVPLDTLLRVPPGDWARLLLDVDLTRSFQPTGGKGLDDATGFSFQPVIYAIMPGYASEVRGVIASADALGVLQPVDRATVFFLPPGTSDLSQSLGSTATDPDGSYCQLGLPPGAYRVLAVKGERTSFADTGSVGPGNYATVDLVLD